MFINENNLKELPQVDVIPPSLELDSAASVRGDNFIMEEIWYDIPNYEGYYSISNLLRFRYYYHYNYDKFHKLKEPKIMKPVCTGKYPQICMGYAILGNRKTLHVHHLVAQVFIPNPNRYPNVLHIDNNKHNYSISNLKWGTQSQNIIDAFLDGIMPRTKGSKSGMSKINETIALDIFNTKGKGYDLRKKYNVTYTVIYNIKQGNTWNHVTGLPIKRKTKIGLK